MRKNLIEVLERRQPLRIPMESAGEVVDKENHRPLLLGMWTSPGSMDDNVEASQKPKEKSIM